MTSQINNSANISFDGVLLPQGMSRYQADFKKTLYTKVNTAMKTIGKEYRDKIRDNASQTLKIKKQSILKSFVFEIYNADTNRLPSLQYRSGIAWMGIHDKGGPISKKVLIPLSKKRIGYKTMKNLISDLSRANNLFFDKKNGTTIAWAKNTLQFKQALAPFRAVTRARNGKVVKKDERVNVAIVGKNIRLRKKIRLSEIALASIPRIVREVERLFTLKN
jgi:hypothetical protein